MIHAIEVKHFPSKYLDGFYLPFQIFRPFYGPAQLLPQKNKINFLLDFDHQQREHRPWGVNNDDGAKVLLLGEDFAVVLLLLGHCATAA